MTDQDMELSVVCRWCGQVRTLPHAMPPEEAEEWAARHCDCRDAAAYRARLEDAARRERDLLRARNTIYDLCGPGAEAYDREGISDQACDLLQEIATEVYDRRIDAATLKYAGTIQVKISRTARGLLKVERKDTDKLTSEI